MVSAIIWLEKVTSTLAKWWVLTSHYRRRAGNQWETGCDHIKNEKFNALEFATATLEREGYMYYEGTPVLCPLILSFGKTEF